MTYQPESLEEAEYLANYDPAKYPITTVTVDVVITRSNMLETDVVLIRRKGFPYRGHWALPGGFMDEGETIRDAAQREVMEEAGMELSHLRFHSIADAPDRDPRGRCISMVHVAQSDGMPYAGDDAVEAKWFPLSEAKAMTLAFDHSDIISMMR